MLYSVSKQAYKLELLKKWKIYDVFYLLLLEQDTTRKVWVKKIPELDVGEDSNEYKVEAIWDNAVYARKWKGHLLKLYYLIAWKGYPKEKNTWESVSAVQHVRS